MFGRPFLLGTFGTTIPTAPATKEPSLGSSYGCAIDITDGNVLYDKNANVVYDYPASIVKIMTVLLVAELKATNMTDTVTWQSSDDLAGGFSQVGFSDGDVVTYTDLVHGMLMVSGGDACQAVARVLGNESLGEALTSSLGYTRFVEMMNEKANQLGCYDTHFANAHGAELHATTARDMAIITGACFSNVIVDALARTATYDIVVQGTNSRTINLTNSIPTLGTTGVAGTKTGSLSGGIYPTTYNLVTLWSSPSGNQIAIATMDNSSSSSRYDDTGNIINSIVTDFPYLVSNDETPGDQPHRYWRLYHPFSATDGSYMGYGEIELMDDSGIDLTSPADAAARATSSSFQVAGTEAAQAFDDVLTKGGAGDYNWWQAIKADGSWIAWDFGEGNEKDISRVRVYSNLDGVARTLDGVRVQYSDDGAIWQTSWVFNGWRNTIGWIDFSRSENRIMDFTMTGDLQIKANETHRVRLANVRLPTMEQFTITMKAATSFPLDINAMTIGYRNMAGGVYEFESTPQVVTFSGNPSGSVSAGELLTTDPINLAVSDDKDLIVAIHISSAAATYASFGYQRSMETGYRAGVNDVTGLSGSGYSAYNGHFIHRLDKIS